MRWVWISLCALILVTGCGDGLAGLGTRPTVTVGLVAPFEGRYRELGQEVIFAVRLAQREANAAGGAGGRMVVLTALDDNGYVAQAEEQARKLATDDAVVAVIGHWLEETTAAAMPVYAEAGIPVVVTAASAPLHPGSVRAWPDAATLDGEIAALAAAEGATVCPDDFTACAELAAEGEFVAGGPLLGLAQFGLLAGDGARFVWVPPGPMPDDAAFVANYAAVAVGAEPRWFAQVAYDAMHEVLAAIEAAADGGAVSRASVGAALGE